MGAVHVGACRTRGADPAGADRASASPPLRPPARAADLTRRAALRRGGRGGALVAPSPGSRGVPVVDDGQQPERRTGPASGAGGANQCLSGGHLGGGSGGLAPPRRGGCECRAARGGRRRRHPGALRVRAGHAAQGLPRPGQVAVGAVERTLPSAAALPEGGCVAAPACSGRALGRSLGSQRRAARGGGPPRLRSPIPRCRAGAGRPLRASPRVGAAEARLPWLARSTGRAARGGSCAGRRSPSRFIPLRRARGVVAAAPHHLFGARAEARRRKHGRELGPRRLRCGALGSAACGSGACGAGAASGRAQGGARRGGAPGRRAPRGRTATPDRGGSPRGRASGSRAAPGCGACGEGASRGRAAREGAPGEGTGREGACREGAAGEGAPRGRASRGGAAGEGAPGQGARREGASCGGAASGRGA